VQQNNYILLHTCAATVRLVHSWAASNWSNFPVCGCRKSTSRIIFRFFIFQFYVWSIFLISNVCSTCGRCKSIPNIYSVWYFPTWKGHFIFVYFPLFFDLRRPQVEQNPTCNGMLIRILIRAYLLCSLIKMPEEEDPPEAYMANRVLVICLV